MSDDYEICDEQCEKCGHWEVRRRECTELDCEDGYYHDCGEDCCCCLHPEPNRACDECKGHGVLVWCPNCGWEPLLKSYMNGKDQLEIKAELPSPTEQRLDREAERGDMKRDAEIDRDN